MHTFCLINKGGKVTFVKFHWLTSQGVKYLTQEEAVVVGGSNHSHATKDLIDAIEGQSFTLPVCTPIFMLATPVEENNEPSNNSFIVVVFVIITYMLVFY